MKAWKETLSIRANLPIRVWISQICLNQAELLWTCKYDFEAAITIFIIMLSLSTQNFRYCSRERIPVLEIPKEGDPLPEAFC